MARIGMLDVSLNESRHPATGGALRLDQQPEFRRTPGAWRTHAPGQSHDGGSRGNRRTFHRHSELEVRIKRSAETLRFRRDGACPSQPGGETQVSYQGIALAIP